MFAKEDMWLTMIGCERGWRSRCSTTTNVAPEGWKAIWKSFDFLHMALGSLSFIHALAVDANSIASRASG
jgi:hypothetical protein